jgi:ComF family protein
LKLVSTILKQVFNSLFTVFFPATCALCKNAVEDVALGVVCQLCWETVKPFQGELCSQCGYAFASQNLCSERLLCGGCRRGLFQFDFARAYSRFEDPLREIIHQFKYRAHPSLAKPLAGLLFSVYQSNVEGLSADLVIPVPMHKSRQRERGFNQACELSKYFGKLAHIPLQSGLLMRIKPTRVQAGLSRRERRLNLVGSFQVSSRERIKDKRVMLIDDVFTTGATVNECAKLLRQNGAQRVNVLTLARVINR